ncbi:hypothetical protein FB451DRAFT_1401641 [Mycena latifolia]|nr:hypothetical protein FB451DRAFT_1401641 [Mycena latifolia]
MRLCLLHSFVVASLLAGTIAAPPSTVKRDDICETGIPECCSRVESASSSIVMEVAAVLDITLPSDVSGNVGISCSPIVPFGNYCSYPSKVECCTGTVFESGLLVLGCTDAYAFT